VNSKDSAPQGIWPYRTQTLRDTTFEVSAVV